MADLLGMDDGISDAPAVYDCCEHCEHDAPAEQVSGSYHEDPCWCQEGPDAD